MSDRETSLQTLAAIASSPDAVAVSQAHLFAAIDALVAVHMAADPSTLNPRQAAMRSPNAVWHAIYSHAENRIHNLKRAAAVAKADA